MLFRPFGKSELQSSVVGFGAWGIGGATPGATSYGHLNEDEALSTIQAAIDNKINLFDTSCVYGYGKSEELLGRALKGQRDKVIIATKGGMKRYDLPLDFSPAALSSSLSESLDRLATEYVDVFQLHNAPSDLFSKNTALPQYLDKELNSGRARQIGLSVKSPEDALLLLKEYDFSTVQVNLNMLDTRAIECGLLDYCHKKNIAVLIRTPLCFGFLTGSIDQNTVFADEDHRSHWAYEQKALWSRGGEMMHEICERDRDRDGSITDSIEAIRFCFTHPAVASVLTGSMHPREVEENALAGNKSALDVDLYNEIVNINTTHSFFYKG